MTLKQSVGALGEAIAKRFFEEKGYVFVDKNYRKPWGEIDIIFKKEDLLVFVEVKSVSRETSIHSVIDTYRPEENMHGAKVKRLNRAIQTYLQEKRLQNRDWRLDLLAVEIDVEQKIGKCRHIQNISI